jgi:acetylglutamate kinase
MGRSGAEARFHQGLRVTDDAALEVVVAVLAGLVNKNLVAALGRMGVRALGVSGADGGLFSARIQDPALGRVGAISAVNRDTIDWAWQGGYLPVIAPLALSIEDDPNGPGQLLNVNGDTAAGELAAALRAEELCFLTDVPGVLDESGQPIESLTQVAALALLSSGVASGGMIPKLEAGLRACAVGTRCRIIDGRASHALREALERGGGTLLA